MPIYAVYNVGSEDSALTLAEAVNVNRTKGNQGPPQNTKKIVIKYIISKVPISSITHSRNSYPVLVFQNEWKWNPVMSRPF
jgi:hypothetical protein